MKKKSSPAKDPTLLSVWDELPLGMILTDEYGLITRTNVSFSQSMNTTPTNLTGKSIYTLLADRDKEKFREFILLCSEQETMINPPRKQPFDLNTGTGEPQRLELTYFPFGKTGRSYCLGALVGEPDVLKLGKELKKQVKLKDTLKSKLEYENELSEMKSRFISIASHEFRTPLAGILSSINLINRYLISDQPAWSNFKNKDKIYNHFRNINESVKNLITILNKFLSLSNIEKGDFPIKYTTFNLKVALKNQVDQFQQICKPGQTLKHTHKGLETNVKLDKYLLKNIINNLISNSIKYSPENSTIKLSSEIFEDTVTIKIVDQGIGIPTEDLDRIFHRFFRAKNAMRFQEGTGLGLNIVKKYVDLMHGQIICKSKQNTGTTFILNFSNKPT
jgi:hypothetical protein